MRIFNTEGPVRADVHYRIDPLSRLDVGNLLELVRDQRYFTMHAPRQTGKTSALLGLQERLNSGVAGDYHCVYVNVEAGQAAREDAVRGMQAVLGALAERALLLGDGFLDRMWPDMLDRVGPHAALQTCLTRWSLATEKPLVLVFDEIDALIGDMLLSVLRQLRAGYDLRPQGFPQSVVLCGVRALRDYRIHAASEKEPVAGGSAFNISAKALRLGDFSENETRALLLQHTEETGQEFTPAARAAVWQHTRGQPWLVNALAAEACFETEAGRDRARSIDEADILDARESLVVGRRTHLEQLADKLKEERVRRVVEPILAGRSEAEYDDRDLEYVRDLGLVSPDSPPAMANPIYAEVAPRELAYLFQDSLVQETAWYVEPSGALDVDRLLDAFQSFFREHSEHWQDRFTYKEAGPQLMLQGFLQRIVNGGGRIEREYGIGRGRTDLLIVWPRRRPDSIDRHVVECKVLHGSLDATIAKGLEQTAGYMDGCAAESGHLVIFDRRDRPWADKVFRREATHGGNAITIWGM